MENNVYETSLRKEELVGQQSEDTTVSNPANAEDSCTEESNVDLSNEDAVVATSQSELDVDQLVEEDSESDVAFSSGLVGKSKAELIALFKELFDSKHVTAFRKDAEQIKIAFYKANKAEIEKQKKEFLAAGGVAEEFTPQGDNYENELKELFAAYRQKRDQYAQEVESEKECNLAVKLQIIVELKELVNSDETINHTFATFRDLQTRWKDSGQVPKANVKELWENYHLHVENFYNFIKINNELRDLDLKKNFEAQTELCEEAGALLLEESVVVAFRKLQKLHDQWREVGPVPSENKEQLWERFKGVSTQINKRHQEHFDQNKAEQMANLALKSDLCDKCEALITDKLLNKGDWEEASQKLIEIQKIWKSIGFAPKKENVLIYSRFREACDNFFEKKRDFFLSFKNEMDNNLEAKVSLCIAAEALVDSTDWKKSTEELLRLQKEWKAIGPVTRKQSDAIWKRFRAACDLFFERKGSHFGSLDSQYEDNLTKKRQLIAQIEAFDVLAESDSFNKLKEFQRQWMAIGFVPMKEKEAVQKEFKKVIDAKFNTLKGSEKDRKIERFKEHVSSIKHDGNDRRVRGEREKLLQKIKEIEGDISLWENNIGFFSKSKNAQSLIDDVNNKIAKAKGEIAVLHEKIAIIDNH